MAPDLLDRIHQLWDTLADFSSADAEAARACLLAGLCDLVGAQNATWVGVVKLDEQPGDPYLGWRPRLMHLLHPDERLINAAESQSRRVERGETDPLVLHNLKTLGTLRVTRLSDVVEPEWFERDYYRSFYLEAGRVDSIWACAPVNTDVEVYFGLHRSVDQPRYSRQECDKVMLAMRGLRWFHRQQMLAFGLLVAKSPLTPLERKVLHGLLTGQTEKQVAATLGHGQHTTHEYVLRIYRKYGVKSRAALLALWMGKS